MDLTDVIEVVRITDVGLVRERNEDMVASDMSIGFVALADGMGGYKSGEVASEIAVLTIVSDLKESLLGFEPELMDSESSLKASQQLMKESVDRANRSIYEIANHYPECAGMGTTVVLGLFSDNKLISAHVGDSRVYRFRNEVFTQITEDHSYVQEQLNEGLITKEQAYNSENRNLVTRALGIEPEVDLDMHAYDVEVGDVYLFCSDGLTDFVDDEEIRLTLSALHANLTFAANRLVNLANSKGGQDNISIIIVKILNDFSAQREYVKRKWYENLIPWAK